MPIRFGTLPLTECVSVPASVLIRFHSILLMLLESLILRETRDPEIFSDWLKTTWLEVARGQSDVR